MFAVHFVACTVRLMRIHSSVFILATWYKFHAQILSLKARFLCSYTTLFLHAYSPHLIHNLKLKNKIYDLKLKQKSKTLHKRSPNTSKFDFPGNNMTMHQNRL